MGAVLALAVVSTATGNKGRFACEVDDSVSGLCAGRAECEYLATEATQGCNKYWAYADGYAAAAALRPCPQYIRFCNELYEDSGGQTRYCRLSVDNYVKRESI